MAKHLVPAVVTLGVSAFTSHFHARHQIAFGCFDQQMMVVGHQDIGVDPQTGALASLGQRFEKPLPILIIVKDLSALVAAGHDMVEPPLRIQCATVVPCRQDGITRLQTIKPPMS